MGDISKVKMPDGSVNDLISKTTRGIARAELTNATTSTAFVATAPGVTALYDGLTIICKNTKVASATGCTLNLNGLGAKRIRRSERNSYVTTDWQVNYTNVFVYDGLYTNTWLFQEGHYPNWVSMPQSEATEGTATTSRLMTAAVLNNTIEGKGYYKAGDNINGYNLSADNKIVIWKENLDITESDNGLGDQLAEYIHYCSEDGNNVKISDDVTIVENTGDISRYWMVTSDNVSEASFGMKVTKEGDVSVIFSDPDAWRKGLQVMIPENIWSTGLSTVSVPNNAATTLTSFSLAPGRYLVMLWAKFAAHADNGYRYIFLTESSSGTSPMELIAEKQIGANNTNISLSLDITMALNNNTSSNKTYYFRAWHKAGAAIDCTPRYHIIKLSEIYS